MYIDMCQSIDYSYNDAAYYKDSEYPNKLFSRESELRNYDEEIYLDILKEIVEIANGLRKVNITHLEAYEEEIRKMTNRYKDTVYIDYDRSYEVYEFSLDTYINLIDLNKCIEQIIRHTNYFEIIQEEIKKILIK